MNASNLAESAQQFLSGQLKEVDVVGIERELRKLWQSAMASPKPGSESSVLRACSLNLILYSEDSDAESNGGNLLDDISINNPCRAVLAISRQASKPQIEAWVSARCHLGEGSKQICCEQITVLSEAQGPEELASAVLPLLVADLPAFLWWRAANLKSNQLQPYVPALDRLIVDSLLSADSVGFLETIKAIISTDRQVFLSDLNWRRLYAWRKLIAQLFENSPFQIADLKRIENITIEYAAAADDKQNAAQAFNSTTAQSWLLLAWLVSRLGWQQTKGLNFSKDGKQIAITIKANSTSSLAAGNIFAVTIDLGKTGQISIGYDWQRQFKSALPPNLLATIAGNGKEATKLTSLSPNLLESYLVGQELKSLNSDPLFEQALLTVAQTAAQA